jgi:hypothetical protein
MARCQGHCPNLGWIAPQRNASRCISMVVLGAKIGNKRVLETFSTALRSDHEH